MCEVRKLWTSATDMNIRAVSLLFLMLVGKNVTRAEKFGVYGNSMVDMIGRDLPFTIFIPTETHLSLLLNPKDSSSDVASAEVGPIVSRVLGFSAVPKHVLSTSIFENQEIELESISGFKLYVAVDQKRGFMVNNFTCAEENIRIGALVLHIINGVLMDTEFEKSMDIDDESEE